MKFLAISVNPVDLLVMKGRYPVTPLYSLHGKSVLGFEGVACVTECGSAVKNVRLGDFVIPRVLGIGTWRNVAILAENHVQRIDKPRELAFAAILRSSVMPAHLLFEDMVRLKPGDWIIQNAATSTIAQMITQFASLRGCHTIGVIRDRDEPDFAAMVNSLKSFGADLVLMEKDLRGGREWLPGKRIVLALDSVLGPSSVALADCLSQEGVFVNYGMLEGPGGQLTLSTEHLFFKQLTFKSFRGSKQLALRSSGEVSDCHNWLIGLFNAGKLRLPLLQTNNWNTDDTTVSSKLQSAIKRAGAGAIGQRKQIFFFPHNA